jgi:hypothetical protein
MFIDIYNPVFILLNIYILNFKLTTNFFLLLKNTLKILAHFFTEKKIDRPRNIS